MNSRLVSSWAARALLQFAPHQVAEKRGARFLQLAEEARSRINEIAPRQAFGLLQEHIFLVDVREKDEFARGHIPDAINLTRGTLEFEIESRAPHLQQGILLYCGAGNRSALAADNLQRMGYTNVQTISGGFQAWLSAGLPAWHGRPVLDD